MKNILFILVASLVLFSSCDKNEDPIFDKSPEERLNTVLSEYKTNLTKGDGYWIAYYLGSAILMKFNDDNTVEFESTYNNGADDRTITYRVGSSQIPELIFESHTVFHAIYEDNLSSGEYEFVFDNISDEQIKFISKTDLGANKTHLSFFKAIPEDIDTVKEMINSFRQMSFFKKVTIEGSDYQADLITFPGEATLRVPTEDGSIRLVKAGFEVTKNGLLFTPAIDIDGEQVNELLYDAENSQYYSEVNGKKIIITISETPPVSEVGIFDKYMSVNLRNIQNTSVALDAMIPEIRKTVTRLSAIQMYSAWGYVLCYAPGTPGGNWGGFSEFTFAELPDSKDQLSVGWGGYPFGSWGIDVYYNDGGQMLLNFLLDPNGLYIAKYGIDSYCLVSNSDPSQYILVE